jgi:hypothetical protein
MTVNHGVPGSSPGWGAKAARNCSLFFVMKFGPWFVSPLARGEQRLQEIAAFFFVMKFGPWFASPKARLDPLSLVPCLLSFVSCLLSFVSCHLSLVSCPFLFPPTPNTRLFRHKPLFFEYELQNRNLFSQHPVESDIPKCKELSNRGQNEKCTTYHLCFSSLSR